MSGPMRSAGCGISREYSPVPVPVVHLAHGRLFREQFVIVRANITEEMTAQVILHNRMLGIQLEKYIIQPFTMASDLGYQIMWDHIYVNVTSGDEQTAQLCPSFFGCVSRVTKSAMNDLI